MKKQKVTSQGGLVNMENGDYPSLIFEQRMKLIKKSLYDHFDDIYDVFKKSTSLIFSFNESGYDDVVKKCARLHVVNYEIERKCIMFLSMEHPLASDLVYVESIIKVLSHLKRIVGLCNNIADSSKEINSSIELIFEIEEIVNYTQLMLVNAFGAFKIQDLDIANELRDDDDKIDQLFDEILEKISEILSEKTEYSMEFINILFIARFLERVADRCVNVGERVIFINTLKNPSVEKIKKRI